MARRLVWSEKAERNNLAILSCWNLRNSSSVFNSKLFFRFEITSAPLAQNPSIGNKTVIPHMRAKRVNNYRLVYSHNNETITLIAIQDLRRERNTP
jgi:plasmid stabilization system protein ParE